MNTIHDKVQTIEATIAIIKDQIKWTHSDSGIQELEQMLFLLGKLNRVIKSESITA